MSNNLGGNGRRPKPGCGSPGSLPGKWRLQLSIGKTVSASYHLNKREARRELDVLVNNERLEFQQAPRHLNVRLDSLLSFKQHFDEVTAKVLSSVLLIRHQLLCVRQCTSNLHFSSLRSWVLCPCLVQRPTCQEGWRVHKLCSQDHHWLPETTHSNIPSTSTSGNCPSNLCPSKDNPETQLAYPPQQHHNSATSK